MNSTGRHTPFARFTPTRAGHSFSRRLLLLKLAFCPRRYNWPQETEARRQRASVDLVRPAAPFPLCAWQSLPSSRASTLAAQIDCQIFESYPTLRRELMQVLG